MDAVDFPEANILIGKGQNEYRAIPACAVGDDVGSVIMCFQLGPEERAQVAETGRIWIHKWTFGQPFQPIALNTSSPFLPPLGGDPQPVDFQI